MITPPAKQFYKLFASCLAVKGVKRSIIVDTERENMYFINNDMYDLIGELGSLPFQDVLNLYDPEAAEVIYTLIQFLEAHDLGFWTEEPERFPALSLDWEHPSLITNAIIDVRTDSQHPWAEIFRQLEGLGCKDLQLRFYDEVPLAQLTELLSMLSVSSIKSVEFIVKYHPVFTVNALTKLTEQFFRVKTITVHSSPKDEIVVMRSSYNRCGMGNILYVRQCIDNQSHCGQINENYFSLSGIRSFTEAKHYNSCLNRKISLDAEGNIMNCPSLRTRYGNIKTHSLDSVIDEHFKAVWLITKDQIEVCRDCEFRYVCTDCRAFLENTLDKPKKCHYDPYTLTWAR